MTSFDFDSTLAKPELKDGIWESRSNPNTDVISLLKDLNKRGQRCIVVTSRSKNSMEEVVRFLKNNSVPVQDLVFTDGEPKAKILSELGVEAHFDDSLIEAKACKKAGVKPVVVAHPMETEEVLESEFEAFFTSMVHKIHLKSIADQL